MFILATLSILSFVTSRYISDVSSAAILDPYTTSIEPSNGLRTRSVPEIVSSCLLTLILCTSYCIRPNLSAPNASTFLVLMRKLNVAFWVVVSPELVFLWACKQRHWAYDFASMYKDRGWTAAHGQFVIMGGLILYRNGSPVQVLSTNAFTKLLDTGCIDFPSITEQDIKSRSQAHPLLATVTLLQVTWFITQCIARGARGLAITQLEAVTIFLIGVHALLLPAWWDKPLDARSFVRIDAKALPSDVDPLRFLHDEAVIDNLHRDFVRQHYLEGNYVEALWNLEVPLERRFHLEISPFKILRFAGKLFTDYEQLYTSFGSRIRRGALEVPVFHSPNRDKIHMFTKTVLGFLFASPYIAMWACHFPSAYDEKLWHIASVLSLTFSALLTTCCFLFCLFAIILLDCTSQSRRVMEIIILLLLGPGAVSGMLTVLVVTGARMAVIIDAFICLKSLSATARLAVVWTNFIPHIT